MPETQKKFDDKHHLGFSLLSDPDHKIAEAYNVWGEKKMYGKSFMGIIRSSFLIDENGNIEYAWYKISPQNTVPELMKVLY
jgi:peroxiredoxin Q/BCP